MELDPITTAIEAMRSKNLDLRQQVAAALGQPDRGAPQAFTMNVNGAYGERAGSEPGR